MVVLIANTDHHNGVSRSPLCAYYCPVTVHILTQSPPIGYGIYIRDRGELRRVGGLSTPEFGTFPK